MDAAGARIEHPADKAPRSRLFAHLMGIEDTNLGIAHLPLHPFGFVDRGPERGLIVRGLDLPAARQPRTLDAEFGHQLIDHLDGVMRDLVHAPGHGATMGGVDVAEREAEFGGDDAAIAAARAPAGMIGFEHDRRKTALGDMMRGRQPGIARADDDDIGLYLAGKFWKGRQRLRRIRPERGGRCHWGPDLCHVSRPARLSFRPRRRRTPSSWRNGNRAL